MNIKKSAKGFTLLEMLLVIAIIAILAGIVIIAINPARQIAAANNAARQSDTLAILNAVHQYGIDARGNYDALNIGSTSDAASKCTSTTDDAKFICIGSDACDGGITTIYSNVVDTAAMYIPAIPQDPTLKSSTTESSGYKIIRDKDNGRFTVCAPLAENEATIAVTR